MEGVVQVLHVLIHVHCVVHSRGVHSEVDAHPAGGKQRFFWLPKFRVSQVRRDGATSGDFLEVTVFVLLPIIPERRDELVERLPHNPHEQGVFGQRPTNGRFLKDEVVAQDIEVVSTRRKGDSI